MTSIDGVFSCGNALHVNDLVDFVSQTPSRRENQPLLIRAEKDGLLR